MDLWALWVETLLRWLHVITGIAWIGSSFYFIHLDFSLRQRMGLPQAAHGEAWQVHGGGFYRIVKFLVAPPELPAELTWFKWEAYATWVSGILLFTTVYYLRAELYLIDPAVMALTPLSAVAASAGMLVFGWAAYDLACRSPLGRNDAALAAVGFVFLVATAWACTKVFSGRGAFMQMGALIGTIMAVNVAMVIIPGQRKVVADLLAARTPDPIHGQRAKQRSLHNNYLTLPVVFIMIANHYPLVYASRYSWAILAVVLIMGAAIRHFFNTRHKGLASPWWTWGVAAAGVAAMIWLANVGADAAEDPGAETAAGAFDVTETLIKDRCAVCHATAPVWMGIAEPPKGVLLDTPARIRAHRRDIAVAAGLTNAMPPANLTGLTAEDRRQIVQWASK